MKILYFIRLMDHELDETTNSLQHKQNTHTQTVRQRLN